MFYRTLTIFLFVCSVCIFLLFVDYYCNYGKASSTGDLKKQLTQLRKDRHKHQRVVVDALVSYWEKTEQSATNAHNLKQELTDNAVSYEEAVKLFTDNTDRTNISDKLLAAHTIWAGLREGEARRLQMEQWLDKQVVDDTLGKYDRQIATVHAAIRDGKIYLEPEEQRESDRLLATPLTSPDPKNIPKWDSTESWTETDERIKTMMQEPN